MELIGLEPTTLSTASEMLFQLSYSPSRTRNRPLSLSPPAVRFWPGRSRHCRSLAAVQQPLYGSTPIRSTQAESSCIVAVWRMADVRSVKSEALH